MDNYNTDINNVLIIGCGGAGLRAAIEVKRKNLSVKVLGKRKQDDAHTTLAAGGINAALANIDHEDSWQSHFADTYLEGYKLGDPKCIEIMVKKSPELVLEIDKWGANFDKLNNGKLNQRYFGAHSYRRTCFSGDYTGKSILRTLLKKARDLNIEIHDDQYVTDLFVKNSTCFGALSFDINSGKVNINLADAVILCTGGHTKIWKKSSSRKQENTGDGILLGLNAGCELIDMELVQFHPTGMVLPEEMAGTLVTEAVRGEGGQLFNIEGQRFMERYDPLRMELSTRDRIAFANYTEIAEGRGTKNGGVLLDISHKDKEFIMQKLPKIYRQFIESQMIDISKEAMEVAPTAHYSMGGIVVNPTTHETNIKGLFAAGEVVGGLHGANRLGGNSLAEILIFGKITGQEATKYSLNLESQIRSKEVIEKCKAKIKRKIRKGKYYAISLQNELSEIMWEYCGVVKNHEKLIKGIKKISEIKKLAEDIDIRVELDNYQDLVNAYNLEASLLSAEATLQSALLRKESRGSHQRSDYQEYKSENLFNIKIKMEKKGLQISESKYPPLNKNLKTIIKNYSLAENLSDKLLE